MDNDNLMLKIDDAIISIRKGWTLDDIAAERDIGQITYPEIVDDMEWEVSLDELLAALN